jgi:hypothetical protein
MLNTKYCVGCKNNHYNPDCWCRKTGKLVWKIAIGIDEPPPYIGKKSRRVPSCFIGKGIVMISKTVLTSDGYWKSHSF